MYTTIPHRDLLQSLRNVTREAWEAFRDRLRAELPEIIGLPQFAPLRPSFVRSEVQVLFRTALDGITPTQGDRMLLLDYGEKAAAAMVTAAVTTGVDKEAALKNAQGFADAASMMVARYEVAGVVAGRKLVSELLAAGLRVAIAALG